MHAVTVICHLLQAALENHLVRCMTLSVIRQWAVVGCMQACMTGQEFIIGGFCHACAMVGMTAMTCLWPETLCLIYAEVEIGMA